jgi:aspartate aminotransferase-like enzyme
MILDEGLDNVIARHQKLADACRAAVKALGLGLLADNPANGVTAVVAPEGLDIESVRGAMREVYGVQIAGGQADYKGKICRLGHMGYVTEGEVLVLIAGLERALKDAGYEFEFGAGVEAAHKVLAD